MDNTIVLNSETFCLFCGRSIPQQYDDYTPFYECNCSDAQLDREIDNNIQKLKYSRPMQKYATKCVLVKVE